MNRDILRLSSFLYNQSKNEDDFFKLCQFYHEILSIWLHQRMGSSVYLSTYHQYCAHYPPTKRDGDYGKSTGKASSNIGHQLMMMTIERKLDGKRATEIPWIHYDTHVWAR